ncbi:hypothetical protein JOC86_000731 [Bacillus pakistanensis]|uniref:Uncharacterized protein n=1 Tax=Rossellomorea pakistanensis TaxID=992288 RepID=A0ABS2N8W9_9BACI|nr:hypothetical protein [Bacillus pakistanensis]MBM7584194.1 hypothetical protein [Bacillus pakistanensis]
MNLYRLYSSIASGKLYVGIGLQLLGVITFIVSRSEWGEISLVLIVLGAAYIVMYFLFEKEKNRVASICNPCEDSSINFLILAKTNKNSLHLLESNGNKNMSFFHRQNRKATLESDYFERVLLRKKNDHIYDCQWGTFSEVFTFEKRNKEWKWKSPNQSTVSLKKYRDSWELRFGDEKILTYRKGWLPTSFQDKFDPSSGLIQIDSIGIINKEPWLWILFLSVLDEYYLI